MAMVVNNLTGKFEPTSSKELLRTLNFLKFLGMQKPDKKN